MSFRKFLAVSLICAFTFEESTLATNSRFPGFDQSINTAIPIYASALQSSQIANQAAKEEEFQR